MSKRKPPVGIYQITTFLAVVLLLLILFVSAAYFFVIPSSEKSQEHVDLLGEVAAMRSTWEARRPTSFRYVVDRDCYCAPEFVEPYIATEEQGSRTAIFSIEIESASGEFLAIPPNPVWIDDLFGLIEQSVREGKIVEVEYDRDLGHPVSIITRPDPAPPDSEYRVEVRDFEIIAYR